MKQVGELTSRISGFGAHWQEVKPHGMPSGDPALMLLKMEDYSKQLADLQEEVRQMAADCAHFSMEDPDFSQLNAISDDISATRVCTNTATLTATLHDIGNSVSTVSLQLCIVPGSEIRSAASNFNKPCMLCLLRTAPTAYWQNARGYAVLQNQMLRDKGKSPC